MFHCCCGASSLNSLVKLKPTLWSFPLSGGSCYHKAPFSLYARGCPAWLTFPMLRQPWMPGATLEFWIWHPLSPIFTDIVCLVQLPMAVCSILQAGSCSSYFLKNRRRYSEESLALGPVFTLQGLRYHVLQDVCGFQSAVTASLLLGLTWLQGQVSQWGLQGLNMLSYPWPDWRASACAVPCCGEPELLLLLL